MWVTKEEEEVKKTKKAFDRESSEPAKMIAQSQQNYEQIKRILTGGELLPDISSKVLSKESRSSQQVASLKLVGDDMAESVGGGRTNREKSELLSMIYDREKRNAGDSATKEKPRPRLHSDEEELIEDSERSSGFDQKRKAFDVENIDLETSSLEHISVKNPESRKAAPAPGHDSQGSKRSRQDGSRGVGSTPSMDEEEEEEGKGELEYMQVLVVDPSQRPVDPAGIQLNQNSASSAK